MTDTALEIAKMGLAEIVSTGRHPYLGVAGIATRTLNRIAELEQKERRAKAASPAPQEETR